MQVAVLLIMLALLQYIYFTMITGLSRSKYNVSAPATTGNETWECLYRVQQNTLEQLIIYIPAVLAFAHYVSATWVLLPGIGYLVGRQLFAFLYVKNPPKRGLGMMLTLLSNLAMVIGTIIAIAISF